MKIKNICRFALLILLTVILFGCGASDIQYDKDLSSVFDIPLDATIEEIINIESSEYDHIEYNISTNEQGVITRIDFAPYTYDAGTFYKHTYRFDPDTNEIISIEYGNILDSSCCDGTNLCNHVEDLKNTLLEISPQWDYDTSDHVEKIMYGTVDGQKCEISYFGENIGLISLSIEK